MEDTPQARIEEIPEELREGFGKGIKKTVSRANHLEERFFTRNHSRSARATSLSQLDSDGIIDRMSEEEILLFTDYLYFLLEKEAGTERFSERGGEVLGKTPTKHWQDAFEEGSNMDPRASESPTREVVSVVGALMLSKLVEVRLNKKVE